MRKRNWSVALRPRPSSDGLDRLGLAVKLVVDRGLSKQSLKTRRRRDLRNLGVDESEARQ